MKKIILLLLLVTPVFCFCQTRQLKLTNVKTGDSVFVKNSDKVLIAYKLAKYQTKLKPSDIYVLSKAEQGDSVFVFVKGHIISVGDSTIILKERNSLFSVSPREIKIDKINSLRKLTTGKQILRTVATAGGSLAFAIVVFYSYAAVAGGEGFVSGMFYAAASGSVLTRFGRTKISKRNLNNWKIETVAR